MRLLLINVLLFLFFGTIAQDKKALDSLTEQAKGTNIIKKVIALNELCRLYSGTDNSKAMDFAKEALNLSLSAKNTSLIAQSKNRLGTIYDYKGIIDSANANYIEALKIFENLGDKSGIASVYQNIGVMYYFQNDLDKAIDYYNKAIVLRNKTNELEFVAKLQNNMAAIFRRQKKYDLAIDYYRRSIEIKTRFKDQEAIATGYSNLAVTYLYMEKFDSSKALLNKALVINKSLNSNINLAGNYFTFSEISFNEKKYLETKVELKNTLEFAEKAESNDIIYNVYELLWQVDTAIGDYKSAVHNGHLASIYKAKVFKEERAKAVEKLNVLYETEKKDNEINTLNTEQEKEKIRKRLLLFGLLVALTIIFIFGFFYKKIKDKNSLLSFQKREIEDKTEALNKQSAEIARHQSQMNPHFIFNALVSIQNFILKENKHAAANSLSQLSQLMRITLYNSEKDFLTLKEEKQFLDFFVEFEKMRFDNFFTYSFVIDESIDIENTLLPPMIIQPFIENSIKHGLIPKRSGGELRVSIYKKTEASKDLLVIEIKDNGIGRTETSTRKRDINHKSKGIDITLNRIKNAHNLSEQASSEHYEVIDLEDANKDSIGTLVMIKLPFIENF
ncbi:MAG: tetratricopeptide repeat protein [Bacteroidota bacterium]|nr:tetratricopeptide repeat protein [Bacteroidota bacterium]